VHVTSPPYAAVTIAGNALRFYDTKDKTSRFLWGAGSGISCFAVSAAGRLIAYVTKGLNPTIHVHAMGSMERVIALEGTARAGVSALAFSRDGKFLAVASAVPDLVLSIRVARTGQVLVESGLESEAVNICFNPFNAYEVLVNHTSGAPSGVAGATLYIVDKVYETYSIETRPLNTQAVGVAPSAVTAAAWSPENSIYLGTDAGALLVVRPGTGEVIAPPAPVSDAAIAGLEDSGELPAGAAAAWILMAGAGAVCAMAFTKQHVLLAGMDGALRFYTHASVAALPGAAAQLHRVVALTDGEFEQVLGMSFNPVFSEAIVTTAECGLYVVNIYGDITPAVAETGGEQVPADAADGGEAGVSLELSSLSVADPVEVVKVGDFHAGAVSGVAPLADGTSVATCGVDGTLRGWDLATGTCAWKRTLSSEQAAMTSGSVAAGSGVIAVASATGVVRVFDAGAGAAAPPHLTLRARLTTDVPDAIAMNAAGTLLAVAGMYGDCWLIEIAEAAKAARVVGYVALPARALAMTWAPDNKLLVSGQGGQVAAITPPTPGYVPQYGLAIESNDAPVQSVMVDCAMTSIAVVAPGQIAGIAADRSIRTYTLPTDAAGWGGRDGQVLTANTTAPDGLGKALGGIVVAGGTLATACNDGGVAVWAGVGGCDGAQLTRMVHDSNEGGAATLAVVPGGRLVTAGLDGAVVVTSSPGMPELIVAPSLLAGVAAKAAAPPAAEFDNFDADDEPTEMDRASAAALAQMQGAAAADADAEAAAAAAAQLDPAVAASREAMAAKIADLRKRLEETIARNDAADELEKIPRKELLVDATFRTQLVAEGDKRVAEVRKRIMSENLRNDYAGGKIKEECWDTMNVHGSAVLGFKAAGLAVHNYPLKASDKAAKMAVRVAFLRRVEMAEEEFLAQPENGGAEDIFALRVDVPKEAVEGDEGEGAAPAEGAEAAAAAAAAALASKPKEDSFEAILYDPFKLYPPRRKMSQLMLLQMVTREIKSSFNAEYHEMTGTKTKYMDKLGEFNQRITEIRDELKSNTTDTAPLFEPKLSDVENDGSVLKVDDSEIKADVYVSPEEEARLAAEAAAEAERLRSKGADDPTERALKEMMGGVLESDKGAAEMEELPKPDWMLEIPKDEWTEEQQKLAKEWEQKAKSFKEELDKRRKALDAELKKLREDVEETTKKFDDHLADFFDRRNATDSRLAEIESWVVACAEEAETALDDDERRQAAIEEELTELKSVKGASSAAVGNFRRDVDIVRERYEATAAEDRQMDKHFKRDFAETDDYFEVIYSLYKRRKNPPRIEGENSGGVGGGRKGRPSMYSVSRRVSNAASRMSGMGKNPRASRNSGGSSIAMMARMARNSNASIGSMGSEAENDDAAALKVVLAAKHDPYDGALGGPVAEASLRPKPPPVEPLDVSFDRPEGLDATWWDRLVEHRERKISKEAEVLALKAQLEQMQRYLAKISEEDAKLQARIEELIVESREFAIERYNKLYDLSVPLKMKQGEVEVMLPDLMLGGGPKANAIKADSMLLHRHVVQDLNEVIQRHGGGKVDTLVAIKDFKKGIYDLQWENTKLHMDSDDLVEKTKQLQLARVGKNFQEIIKEGAGKKDEDGAGKKGELANLEARLDHNRKLHARTVVEKKKDISKMKQKIREKAVQNDEISTQVAEMDVSVGEQLRINDQRGGGEESVNMGNSTARSIHSQGSGVGQGQGGGPASAAAERKMRALVTQQKLKDIAKAQAEEMMMLRTELERARLRTFPSFVERNGGHPDIR
jgi:WD40 repeat protein